MRHISVKFSFSSVGPLYPFNYEQVTTFITTDFKRHTSELQNKGTSGTTWAARRRDAYHCARTWRTHFFCRTHPQADRRLDVVSVTADRRHFSARHSVWIKNFYSEDLLQPFLPMNLDEVFRATPCPTQKKKKKGRPPIACAAVGVLVCTNLPDSVPPPWRWRHLRGISRNRSLWLGERSSCVGQRSTVWQ
jgi:hypothetical protein